MNVHDATPLSSPPSSSDTVFFNALFNYMRFDAGSADEGGGRWRDNQKKAGQKFLYDLFDEGGSLEHINTGDLVWIDQDDVSHSFVIVGWGKARECPVSLNAQVGTHFHIERLYNGREIPYIADFCYGRNETESEPPDPPIISTRWVQDARPRPFYCSSAQINNNQLTVALSDLGYSGDLSGYLHRLGGVWGRFSYDAFNLVPYWRFFHIPDKFHVTKDKIYCLCS